MEKIDSILKRKNVNNDNNEYKNISINANNVNNVNNDEVSAKGRKYGLNRSKFTPNTEETQLAEDIANYFNDLKNYAFYLHVVKSLGVPTSLSFWKSIKEEIEEKKNNPRYAIRYPSKYFTWKFKKKLY